MLSILIVIFVSGFPIYYFARNNASTPVLLLVGIISVLVAWAVSVGLAFASAAGQAVFERHFGMYFWMSIAGAACGSFYGKKFRVEGAVVPRAVAISLLFVVSAAGFWLLQRMATNDFDSSQGTTMQAGTKNGSDTSAHVDKSGLEVNPSSESTINSDKGMEEASAFADRIILEHLELNPSSPKYSQVAVDKFILYRDEYLKHGHTLTGALVEAEKKYVQSKATSALAGARAQSGRQSNSQSKSDPTWYEQQEARLNGCQPKDVMTDAEIEKCRTRN